MAVQVTKQIVCDVCGKPAPDSKFRVGFPRGGLRSFDLCDKHAEPLMELARVKPSRAQRARPVTTVANVSKKAKKKPPAS